MAEQVQWSDPRETLHLFAFNWKCRKIEIELTFDQWHDHLDDALEDIRINCDFLRSVLKKRGITDG